MQDNLLKQYVLDFLAALPNETTPKIQAFIQQRH